VPHFSRPLREVGTTDAVSAAVELDVAFAHVERTLLSVAFDLGFGSDVALVLDLVIPKRAKGARGTCCCMQRHNSCSDSRLGCPSHSGEARYNPTPRAAFFHNRPHPLCDI
jgi:hypothetical protein